MKYEELRILSRFSFAKGERYEVWGRDGQNNAHLLQEFPRRSEAEAWVAKEFENENLSDR
jgi:hypothetical protein